MVISCHETATNNLMKYTYFFLGLLCLFSCSPSQFVKPLAKGQRAINTSIGGPLIKFAGADVPMPFTSITGGYGLTKSLTLYGNFHSTALIFGVFQTELGIIQNVYFSDSLNIGFSISPGLNMAMDKWEYNFKLWPRLDFNAYWSFNKNRNFIYVGVSNWFELSKTKGYGEPPIKHWLFNPELGHSFVTRKWNFKLEFKLLAAGLLRYPNVIEYVGFGERGAIGTYVGIARWF